jgi:hypothetical protein
VRELWVREAAPPESPVGRRGGRVPDPNTNSFVRVWGAPSRTAEGKRRGGHTWWMLVAGKGLGEDVTNGAAARPVVAARDQGRKSKEGESERRKGLRNRGGDEPEALEP